MSHHRHLYSRTTAIDTVECTNTTMPTIMMNLRLRLRQRGITVKGLAAELGVPLKTVQDWVYRGVAPSPSNQRKLDEFMACTHHWVIDAANGHTSRGVCQVCNEVREFENSIEKSLWVSAKTADRA